MLYFGSPIKAITRKGLGKSSSTSTGRLLSFSSSTGVINRKISLRPLHISTSHSVIGKPDFAKGREHTPTSPSRGFRQQYTPGHGTNWLPCDLDGEDDGLMLQLQHEARLAEKISEIAGKNDSKQAQKGKRDRGQESGGISKARRGSPDKRGKDIAVERRQSVTLASMRRRSIVGPNHQRQDLTQGEMQKLQLLRESDGTIRRCINFKIEELDRVAEGQFWQQLAGNSQEMESYNEEDLQKL